MEEVQLPGDAKRLVLDGKLPITRGSVESDARGGLRFAKCEARPPYHLTTECRSHHGCQLLKNVLRREYAGIDGLLLGQKTVQEAAYGLCAMLAL